MRIVAYTRQVYGETKTYVAGQTAATIYNLTRRLTLNDSDIRSLKNLGHDVVVYDSEQLAKAEAQ